MSDTWRRWAQRRRLIGVIYLGAAAVGFSVAAFLYITAVDNPVQTTTSGMVAGGGGLLIILAIHEFIDAHKWARLAARQERKP